MLANGLVAGVGERETRRKGGSGPSRAFKWGGLSQLILSEGDVKAKALVLVETIPCFGS